MVKVANATPPPAKARPVSKLPMPIPEANRAALAKKS